MRLLQDDGRGLLSGAVQTSEVAVISGRCVRPALCGGTRVMSQGGVMPLQTEAQRRTGVVRHSRPNGQAVASRATRTASSGRSHIGKWPHRSNRCSVACGNAACARGACLVSVTRS